MAYVERYSNPTGSGLANGTSPSDAWSLVTAATSLTAGQRLNHTGDVTLTSDLTWSNLGTAANPMALRAYASSPGDLSGSRTNGGNLDDSGSFPTITISGNNVNFFTPVFAEVEFFDFVKSGTSIGVLTPQNNTYSILRSCLLRRSDANGTTVSLGSSDYALMDNCDVYYSGSSSDEVIGNNASITHCRFSNPSANSSANYMLNLTSETPVMGCQFIDVPLCITTLSTKVFQVVQCSFRNCDNAINYTAASVGIIEGCIAWGSNNAGSEFFKGGGTTRHVKLVNNAAGNFADADQDTNDLVEVNRIALTADPFTSSSDLRPNSTAGGGAAIAAQSEFGNDLGAIQAAASGGGGRRPRGRTYIG